MCDQPGFGAVKAGLQTKAFGSSLGEKLTFLTGARAVFLLEVVLGKPRSGGAAWSTELILDVDRECSWHVQPERG